MISVTKLIDLLNKPGLVYWANNIGLKGLSLNDYRVESSKNGTNKHIEAQMYLEEGVKFDGCFELDKSINGFEFVCCEKEVKTDHLIGRIDLILKKDDLTYIIDFKSSEKIYLSTKLQLSTYKHMFNADKIGVINLNNMSLTILDIDTSKYYELVKRLYQIKNIMIKLKESL